MLTYADVKNIYVYMYIGDSGGSGKAELKSKSLVSGATCFTGTKVQMLTLRGVWQSRAKVQESSVRCYLLYWYKSAFADAAGGPAKQS
jgi:hypothetical protein